MTIYCLSTTFLHDDAVYTAEISREAGGHMWGCNIWHPNGRMIWSTGGLDTEIGHALARVDKAIGECIVALDAGHIDTRPFEEALAELD